jgi:hypothetical protein
MKRRGKWHANNAKGRALSRESTTIPERAKHKPQTASD